MIQNNKKVLLNTGILYIRMFLSIGMTLYTTRLILEALGTVDFGIFNVVAGATVFLSFINAAMTTSTQRFLSFYQGKNSILRQKIVFCNSLLSHIALGFIMLIGLLIIKKFLFSHVFNIPFERESSAMIVYVFMGISVFFTILNVPFSASINAHEDIFYIAIVTLIENFFRLCVAFFISNSYTGDKLIAYGFSFAGLSFISFLFLAIFSLKKYSECTLLFWNYLNTNVFFKLNSFASWNTLGALCGVSKNQGISIIYNMFLGPQINASYAISNQLGGQMNFFSSAMMQALNPQIMRSEGENNRKRMMFLSILACKYGCLLVSFIAIPSIFEINTLLKIWLGNVPEHTAILCIIIIIVAIVYQVTIGMQSALYATGCIKNYQIIVGLVLLMNLPVAFLLLKLKFPFYSVMISYLSFELLASFLRVFLVKYHIDLSIRLYSKEVLVKVLYPILSSTLFCIIWTNFINSQYRIFMTYGVSIIIFGSVLYTFSMSKREKNFLKSLLNRNK